MPRPRSLFRLPRGRPEPTSARSHESPFASVVVSFFNRPQAPPLLGVVDAGARSFSTTPLSAVAAAAGITGLAASSDFLFFPVQRADVTGVSAIVALRRATLEPAAVTSLRARDVHSLSAAADALFPVSTGTDEVLELTLDEPEVVRESVVWRPGCP